MSSATFRPIFTKKEFTDDGELVRLWFKVGVVKRLPSGQEFLQLYQQPHTDFFIFEPKEELPAIE